jgi:hypothetical protein
MRKKLVIILLAGLIFYIRYLFLITVMAEERTPIYEPLRVVGAKMEGGVLKPLYIPSRNEEFLKEKKIGPFVFLIRTYPRDPHPVVKMRIGKKGYPFLYLPYVGPIQLIYTPRIYLSIFGRNIYSLRSLFFLTFILFLFFYSEFSEKMLKREGLLKFYLITFPIFGMPFAVPIFWNQPAAFICEILIMMRLKKVFEEKILNSGDFVFLLFLSGFLIHVHLLAGSLILFSISLSFIFTKRRTSFNVRPIPFISGLFIFFVLILPFIMTPFTGVERVVFRGKNSIHEVLFTPIYSILYYMAGIFGGPSFMEIFLHDEFGLRYLPFSFPSGVIMACGFLGLIFERKNPIAKFFLMTSILYLFISSFGDIRSYHINYILPLIALFIPDGLKGLGLSSQKMIKFILLIGIFLNIIQIEMLRESIKNSSLSLSLHKEVADYLTKNRIKKIHNIAGMYDYVFISKERIEVIDFIPFIGYNHPRDRIYLSLILSRGEVILLESYKRAGITTGVSLEEVIDIAKETGLRIRVLKKFPDKGKYELVLARVE